MRDRHTIDNAKRLLMARHGIVEQEAYRRLQRAAMDRRRRLVDVAADLLASADLLNAGS